MSVFFRGPLKILNTSRNAFHIYIRGKVLSFHLHNICFRSNRRDWKECLLVNSEDRNKKERTLSQRFSSPLHRHTPELHYPPETTALRCFFHGALHADRSTDFCQLLYSCREWGANRFQLYNPSLCERLPSDRDRGPPRTVRLSATNWCILHHNHDRNSVGADRHHCGTQGTSRYYPATWLSQGYVVYQ